MRGYVEFNLSQRCFGPAQFEATLLRQTYLRKIVSSRQKEKENVSPFLFSFVFHRSLSTVNRDESVDRLCTNENVGQRHRIDVSPRFSSSFNKIHSWELHVLSRNFDSRLSKIFCRRFTKHVHVWRRIFLSFSLLSFSFSRKNWKQSPSSDYPLYDRFLIVPKQEGTSLMEFWNSRIRTRDISFFLPPFTNAQYHRKIDDDDDEKPRHLETTISILLFSLRIKELKRNKKKEEMEKNLKHRRTMNRDRL